MSRSHPRLIEFVAILTLSAGLAACAPAPAGGYDDPSRWNVETVPLPNRGVAFDPGHNLFLVSVAASVPQLGNHVVELDPRTGAIGRTVALRGGPGTIRVAADASIAYVILRGTPRVAVIDLSTFEVADTFTVGGTAADGAYRATDLAVDPADPSRIVMSRQYDCCSGGRGTALFEDGEEVASLHGAWAGSLTWGPSPDTVYGSTFGSLPNVYEFAVGTSTLTVTSEVQPAGVAGALVTYHDGRLHTSRGAVLDAATLTLEGSYGTASAVAIDRSSGRTFVYDAAELRRHDSTDLSEKWSLTAPDLEVRTMAYGGGAVAIASDDELVVAGPQVSTAQFVPPSELPSVLDMPGTVFTDFHPHQVIAAPTRDVLYVLFNEYTTGYGSGIAEMDPTTGGVLDFVAIANDPRDFAVSDDGLTALVGHDDANAVTEVDLATFTVARVVPLASNHWAKDIEAVPGTPNTFAVVVRNHCCSPSVEGVVVVEDGVVLPEKTPGHTGPTMIEFVDGSPHLYGAHNGGGLIFYTMEIDHLGIRVIEETRAVIGGSDNDLVAHGSLIYGAGGSVVDPLAPERIARVADGDLGIFGYGAPLVLEDRDRVVMFDYQSVNEYRLDDLSRTATSMHDYFEVFDAERVGDTVAVRTGEWGLVLVPLA